VEDRLGRQLTAVVIPLISVGSHLMVLDGPRSAAAGSLKLWVAFVNGSCQCTGTAMSNGIPQLWFFARPDIIMYLHSSECIAAVTTHVKAPATGS
jgi:hypothetical protein